MSRDYLKLGDYNAQCDRCGRKFKASELVLDWQGLRVCFQDFEPRQPQDFVRGETDPHPIPWSRPKPEPDFLAVCSLEGITAVTDDAVCDCAVCDRPAFPA